MNIQRLHGNAVFGLTLAEYRTKTELSGFPEFPEGRLVWLKIDQAAGAYSLTRRDCQVPTLEGGYACAREVWHAAPQRQGAYRSVFIATHPGYWTSRASTGPVSFGERKKYSHNDLGCTCAFF
jgi:hypothetical protein